MRRRTFVVGLVLVLIFLLPAGLLRARRPSRASAVERLFPSVVYTREAREAPRPLMVHLVEVDVSDPDIHLLVTPGDSSRGLELRSRTTSAFAEAFGVQVAVNGSFFEPFRAGRFLTDYYPHSGDPVDVLGLAIADGRRYSAPLLDRPVLCATANRVAIHPWQCPPGTTQALAGKERLVEAGRALTRFEDDLRHPRTAMAVDATGATLWLIVVDGRQPGYSEGLTLAELAALAAEVGAHDAVNLDGGGSTTLVTRLDGAASVRNAPVHKRIPTWERPVGNHLGVVVAPAGAAE